MITSNLGGGIFFYLHIFKMAEKVSTKKKAAYFSKYCFAFWGADGIYEVPEEVRGHDDVVDVKVILAK